MITTIWAFFYTSSHLIFPTFFVILPYGFLHISSSASQNFDILISQWSLSLYVWYNIKNLEFLNLMTRIWVFFCTSSHLIVTAFSLILPYGFLRISSSESRNSDLSSSQWSLSSYLWFDIKILEVRNFMTNICAFFCTASRLIVLAFFVILPYGFLRISSSAYRNSDL